MSNRARMRARERARKRMIKKLIVKVLELVDIMAVFMIAVVAFALADAHPYKAIALVCVVAYILLRQARELYDKEG